MPASEVGATILVSQLKATRPPALGERLLPEEYFDFRGGVGREREPGLRTRFGEAGPASAHQH